MSSEQTSPATRRAPPRKRNPRGHGGRLREEIVGAATRLVDADGPGSVTLRAIAREAGISAPSIYDHFADVGEIFAAVVAACFAELTADITGAQRPFEDPVARLHAGCRAYVDYGVRHPERYALLFRATPPRDLPQGEIGDAGAAAFKTLVGAIAACAAAGRSTSVEPFVDAVALWSGMHGYASLRAARPQFPWPQDDTLARIVDRLARVDA